MMSFAEEKTIEPPMTVAANIYASESKSNTQAGLLGYSAGNTLHKMDIATSLDALMKKKGLSQYRLSDISNVPQPTIQRILSKETKNPKTDTVKALAIALDVSISDLISGAWNELPEQAILPIAAWDDTTPLDRDEAAIPLFKEIEIAAGNGCTVHAVTLNHRKLRFSRATLAACGVDESNAACATIRGNSMERLILDGSTIGIDRGKTDIRDGEIYAIDHDGMLRVKYLYRLPGGGLRLRSENSVEYMDEIIDVEQVPTIHILGWVFWWSTVRTWKGR